MKPTLVCSIILFCLLMPSYAQEKPLDVTDAVLDYWVNDATNPNNEALLFKAIWFDEQNPRSSDRCEVYCNGITYYARVSVMGTGPSGFTVLNLQQIADIKQIISELT